MQVMAADAPIKYNVSSESETEHCARKTDAHATKATGKQCSKEGIYASASFITCKSAVTIQIVQGTSTITECGA
jgi:hypothetical protein